MRLKFRTKPRILPSPRRHWRGDGAFEAASVRRRRAARQGASRSLRVAAPLALRARPPVVVVPAMRRGTGVGPASMSRRGCSRVRRPARCAPRAASPMDRRREARGLGTDGGAARRDACAAGGRMRRGRTGRGGRGGRSRADAVPPFAFARHRARGGDRALTGAQRVVALRRCAAAAARRLAGTRGCAALASCASRALRPAMAIVRTGRGCARSPGGRRANHGFHASGGRIGASRPGGRADHRAGAVGSRVVPIGRIFTCHLLSEAYNSSVRPFTTALACGSTGCDRAPGCDFARKSPQEPFHPLDGLLGLITIRDPLQPRLTRLLFDK